jgi:hypothetical protein
MRRFVGPVLVGLGVFLVVVGVLLRFYAYPKLAVAPVDQNSVTKLSATDATLFDTATLSEITTDLSVQSRTVGDVAASEEQGDNVRIWTGTTSYRDSEGQVRSRSAERTPFDATSAEAVNCCGAFQETTDGEREPVKRTGLVWKFPFDTQKQTYKVWESTLGAAVDAKFVKETDIDDLKVYEFQIEIPRTQTGTREVPASVVDEDGDGNVTAETYYSNSRTLWVEPVTGAIIDRNDDALQTLGIDGEDRVTTTGAQLSYTDQQVKDNVEEYKTKASLLSKVHGLFPLLALILGVVALGAGVLLSRRNTAAEDTTPRGAKATSGA